MRQHALARRPDPTGRAPRRSAKFARVAALLLAFAAGLASPARADIDPGELQAHGAPRDRRSQARALRQIEIDRSAEARRGAEEAAAAERAEQERRRADEARPWPVRLTEQRCTPCHPATNYTRNAHALPGWWWVGLRMKYVNKAPVGWDDLRVIVPHLAATQPADRSASMLEWGLALLALAGPVLVALAWRFARGRVERTPT